MAPSMSGTQVPSLVGLTVLSSLSQDLKQIKKRIKNSLIYPDNKFDSRWVCIFDHFRFFFSSRVPTDPVIQVDSNHQRQVNHFLMQFLLLSRLARFKWGLLRPIRPLLQ